MIPPDVPTVDCEGSGYPTHLPNNGLGYCSMCGQLLPVRVFNDKAVDHQRVDVLAVAINSDPQPNPNSTPTQPRRQQ